MVVQAITLAQMAARLGVTVPAVVEIFNNQGIDLSGFGESDIIPLEDLFPQQKTFRTYDESFYRPEPVVGSTVLETKKDDDDIIDVKEEELEKMPRTEMTKGDEPEDPEPEPPPKKPTPDLLDQLFEEFVNKQAQKQFKKAEEFLAKDKNSKQYVETLNPVKIYGDKDVREIDYSTIKGDPINFEFDDQTVQTIGERAVQEMDDKSNVDVKALTEKFGFEMPSADFINKSLKGDDAARFWYERGAQWVDNFLEGYSDEDKNKFFDILSITSGGVDPKQNLKIAIGVFSDYKNNRPIRMGFRQYQSLDKFLSSPDQVVNTPKFGNYVDTFKYFTGLTDREPNTVNDLQMARIFGIDPTVLASNPELYALITNSINRLTFEINKTRPDDKKIQPFQLQALMWSESRGGSTNYQDMGNELVADLQEKGFKFRDGKLDPIEILDPQFVEKLQATIVPYKKSLKATIEVGTFLTPNGKQIETLINNFPEDNVLMNQISNVHRSSLNKLITKQKKQPSVMEQAVSLVLGQKAEISRMEIGLGTYEGKANFNVVVPLTVKVGNKFVELTEPQRLQVLSLLGENLNQDAMATSNFTQSETPLENRNKTAQLFYRGDYTKSDIQKIQEELGIDFNVQNTAGGFVASFLTFDNKSPDPQLLDKAFTKVLGDDADMVYIDDVYWYGDYIDKKDYRKNNNELKKSITQRISGDDGDSVFDIGYLDSIVKIIKQIDNSTDEGYGKILQSGKVIKLLQSLKEPIKKAIGGLVEKPKFYFGRLIDIYNL
jgi:DNA-binding protein YbaB